MAGFVDTQEQAILNYFFRAATWTLPADLYIGLSTTTPTEAGGSVTEPAGMGYARVAVTRNTSNWTAATGVAPAVIDNTNAITGWTAAGGSWGTITHVTIHDASTSGNVLGWAALTASKTVADGDSFQFDAGALDWKLGDPGDTY